MPKSLEIKLHGDRMQDGDITFYTLTVVDEDGASVNFNTAITLAGYAMPTAGNLDEEDSMLAAFNKLEGRIMDLEDRVTTLEEA